MDGWTDGTVKLSVRPFYATDRPVCDGRNGRTDADGDEICPSAGWADAILSRFMDGMDGRSLMETPL